MDFVIPLLQKNLITQSLIEAINLFYKPRHIFIVTSKPNILIDGPNIVLIDESVFFKENYNLTKTDIEQYYCFKDNQSREFGWWYQQLIKLGAVYQIPQISDPYVVWDSDLIPIIKWEIDSPDYKFALLQDKAKSEWNKEQYRLSIKEFIDLEASEPESGTFIPHHFVFHHKVLNVMLPKESDWIKKIIQLSQKYYRFSEYKCTATYMEKYFPQLLKYHEFDKYGSTGIRFREYNEIINKLLQIESPITYEKFLIFAQNNFPKDVSYIQIEHLPEIA
jgi:hypothetical protein